MRSLILLMILGFIGTKTVQSKCVEGEPCATDSPFPDVTDANLVPGIPSGGHVSFNSSAVQMAPRGFISCGNLYCYDSQTCCGHGICCSLADTRATCCSNNKNCCPSASRCCGSSSMWCCGRRDGCASITGYCIPGGRAAFGQSVSVASLFIPVLMAMAFFY